MSVNAPAASCDSDRGPSWRTISPRRTPHRSTPTSPHPIPSLADPDTKTLIPKKRTIPAARKTSRRRIKWSVAVLLVLFLLPAASWALDTSMSADLVVRNAELGGQSVGGMNATRLAPVVAATAQRLAGSRIEITTPGGPLDTTAAEVGLVVDQKTTVTNAISLGSQSSWWKRPFEWLRSFVAPREVPVLASLDDAKLTAVVAQRDPTKRVEPVEPTIADDGDGALHAVKGINGHGLDPATVRRLVIEAAARGATPLRVTVSDTVLRPRFSLADAERLARQADALMSTSISVEAGDTAATVTPAMLRRWAIAVPGDVGLVLDLDDAKVIDDLEKLLPDVGTPPVDAGFKVVDGSPIIIPGVAGTTCCAPVAPERILQALTAADRSKPSADLPLRVAEPERTVDDARAMGIVEQVGSFTTNHPANQPRVANIHRIADLVQGTIIEPGKRLSVNTLVGRRTTAAGFVPAGVIYEGAFTEDVGGGVSQFATTLFNAAFFAGLDIPEYQSHSIWISRYPRGREATLSYPKPDLVIENTTPHAVLIWNTYNATSITVTLYSTRTVVAEQTGQSEAPVGACTRVTTERTRRWLADNRTKVDRFRATYRPEEGVAC